MFKLPLRLKLTLGVLLSCVVLGLIFDPALLTLPFLHKPNSDSTSTKIQASSTTITSPKAQDLFMPFVLAVPLHTTVTWRNDDSIAHRVMTTAQQSRFLNLQMFSFRIPVGSQAQFTFNRAGLYHYYDPTVSSWNSSMARVAAKQGTPHFPLAMDGVIWVQGSIPSLPTSATDLIPAGHDNFTDEFLAISTPGGVTWHNFDDDPHFIGLVEGWSAPINPVDIGLYRIAGTDDVPGGSSTTAILNKAGLYYYYCRNHSVMSRFTHRAEAMSMASEYPIAMEGFILALSPS